MIGREGPGPERPGPDYPPEWDTEPTDDEQHDGPCRNCGSVTVADGWHEHGVRVCCPDCDHRPQPDDQLPDLVLVIDVDLTGWNAATAAVDEWAERQRVTRVGTDAQ